jgi:small subunit ribosomal protein S1
MIEQPDDDEMESQASAASERPTDQAPEVVAGPPIVDEMVAEELTTETGNPTDTTTEAPEERAAPMELSPETPAEPVAETSLEQPEPQTMAELLAMMPEATPEEAALAAGERRPTEPGAATQEGRRAVRGGRPRLKLQELEIGAEMRGKVINVAQFGAFVDIGALTDGLVHISELGQRRVEKVEDVLKQGDAVTVWVKEVDVENNRVSLSMRRRDLRPLDSLELGETIEGSVTSLTPFGAFVDIGADTEGLLHVSEMSTRRVNKPEEVVQVGDAVTVWVKEVDPAAGRVSLSMRPRDLRSIDSLEPGETFEGTVTSIATYGAFVDFGAETDGLVHISALADRRVTRPEDVVKVGDTVTVWVKEVDPAARRVALSMRTRPSRPIESLVVEEVLTGTISSVTKYGVFVNIGSDTDGLVHVSQMGSGFVKDPTEYVKAGTPVEVRVTDVDVTKGRISLSMIGLANDVGGEMSLEEVPVAEEDYEAEPEEKMPTAVELALRKALGGEDKEPATGSPPARKSKAKPKHEPAMGDLYARMIEEYRAKKS